MSEEKTRIIRRTNAAVPTDRPHRSGDKIVFFCPNGDRVIVPASFAGKRGVCSKCKVPVVIPILPVEEPGPVLPADLTTEETPAEESIGAEPPALDPVAGGPDGPDGVVPGAAAPSQPDEAAPEADGWQFVAGGTDPHAGLASEPAAVASAAGWIPPLPPVDGGPAAEHPTARLVARLWVERGHGGIVELHMGGGGVILPEWYEPQWSRGTHGLFASQAVDGSVTLTAVAWDKIEKIVVRKVQGLPDGMFE